MLDIQHHAAALGLVRQLDRQRVKAMRENDADALAPLLDDELIYLSSTGQPFTKATYLNAIRTHGLTYGPDIDFIESEHRISNDLVILVGAMLGHARLEADAQVFHLVGMEVWRRLEGRWALLTWQSSTLWHPLGQPAPPPPSI